MEGRVVVIVSLTVYKNKQGIFAARFQDLGLTSYGYTISTAVGSVKRLFNTFIKSYRKNGRLADRLNELGVDWHWVKTYDRPYEDTDVTPPVEENHEAWQPVDAPAVSLSVPVVPNVPVVPKLYPVAA
jgi:hypothetical protein